MYKKFQVHFGALLTKYFSNIINMSNKINAKSRAQIMHNLHHAVTKSLSTIAALNRAMFDERDVGAYFDDACDEESSCASSSNASSCPTFDCSVPPPLSVRPIVSMYIACMQEFTDCSAWVPREQEQQREQGRQEQERRVRSP